MLAIIGVAAVIVAPRMQTAVESFLARQVAHGVSDTFYDLRAMAAMSGHVVNLQRGPKGIRVIVDRREAPNLTPTWATTIDEVQLTLLDSPHDQTGWSVAFHPDGRVSPVEIVIAMRGRPRFFVHVSENGVVEVFGEAGR